MAYGQADVPASGHVVVANPVETEVEVGFQQTSQGVGQVGGILNVVASAGLYYVVGGGGLLVGWVEGKLGGWREGIEHYVGLGLGGAAECAPEVTPAI